jgi:signal transduction histidine kinase
MDDSGSVRAGAPAPMPSGRIIAVVAAVVVLVTAGQVIQPAGEPAGPIALTIALAVSSTVTGVTVLLAVHRHPVGLLLTAAGAFATLSVVGASWAAVTPLAWLSQWTWWPPYGLITIALLLFPDGRSPGRGWGWLGPAIAVTTATATVALAIAALDHPTTLLVETAEPISARARAFILVAVCGVGLTLLGTVAVVVSLFARWRRASGDTRSQLVCLLPAAAVLALALIAAPFVGDSAAVIAGVAIPAGMMLAVLRHRLYNLDTIIDRTLVWLVMTLLVIVAFIATVALIRQAVTWVSTGTYESLIATGVIAVAFEPARRRVQRGVNRLLYGERDDPYLVIARMARVLGHSPADEALAKLTTTIADSLQVPYVAVVIDEGDDAVHLAETGRSGTPIEAFPMTVHGKPVGRLEVATRNPNGRFNRRERRLFTDLAPHAAVAVETARLIRDLRSSREHLVVAREEERRRLRRDLHDRIGPSLAGMAMQTRAARNLVAGNKRAAERIAALLRDLAACDDELRQVVDRVRPAALDNGLEPGLRYEVNRFRGDDLTVCLVVTGDLDGLPAAIEVAAWHIVAEALTNVARHANAGSCQVTVARCSDGLSIDVVDDGVGVAGAEAPGRARRGGLGLESMRSRADELGGRCEIAAVAPTGTAVRVWLPLVARPPAVPRPRRPDDDAADRAATDDSEVTR